MLSAPPKKRGITVSFAQASISASRAIGPALAGALWSWGLANGFKSPFNQNILVRPSPSSARPSLIVFQFVFQTTVAALQLVTSFGLFNEIP
jgi:hypothetical protein